MSFQTQQAKALVILGKTGMWRSNYEPPALRLAWRLGLHVPPPHFANLWAVFACCSLWFAIGWGAFMWLAVWSFHGMGASIVVVVAVSAGLLFGAAMVGYYAYGRHKYALPSWQSLACVPNT